MQNQIRTNEIRVDLLRRQNDSLKASLEKLLTMNHNNNHDSSMVSEERYEELRSQSRQEQPHRRYSFANETVPSVGFSHQNFRSFICIYIENEASSIVVIE